VVCDPDSLGHASVFRRPRNQPDQHHAAGGGTVAENSCANGPTSFCRQTSRTICFPSSCNPFQSTEMTRGVLARLKRPTACEPSSSGFSSTNSSSVLRTIAAKAGRSARSRGIGLQWRRDGRARNQFRGADLPLTLQLQDEHLVKLYGLRLSTCLNGVKIQMRTRSTQMSGDCFVAEGLDCRTLGYGTGRHRQEKRN